MKIKDLAKKVKTPTIDIMIKLGDTEEKFAFPQLTVGDWKEIKRLASMDMWKMLLNISGGVDEKALKGKSKAEREDAKQRAGMDMFKELDHGIQLAMFYQSLKHVDSDLEEEDVDRIISYGIQDQAVYARALTFFIYGISEEAMAEVEAEAEADNPLAKEKKDKSNSTSKDER